MKEIHEILNGITSGSVPSWITACMVAVMAWRGVPGFLTAIARGFELIANRQSQIEQRLSSLLDEQAERFRLDMNAQAMRFERENETLRRQHDECQATGLRQSERIDMLEAEVTKLREERLGLLAAFRQSAASAVSVLPGSLVSRDIQDAADRVKGTTAQ